jgi:hypothetical protein
VTRPDPFTHLCSACGVPLIAAIVTDGADGYSVTLDAAPTADGAYRAWYGDAGWLAQPAHDGDAFHGMRRSEHHCRPPDVQLELA